IGDSAATTVTAANPATAKLRAWRTSFGSRLRRSGRRISLQSRSPNTAITTGPAMYGEMGFVFMRRDGVSLLCYGSAGDLIGAAMPQKDITTLLVDWRNGDQDALSELTPLVYSRLRQLAAAQLRREKPGHTLQSTALVHEAYLKLIDQTRVQWHDRNHFFAIAAQIIRRVLVNHARKRGSSKRGGGRTLLSLNESVAAQNAEDVDLLALDDALDNLARLDPQQARIIELRSEEHTSELQ